MADITGDQVFSFSGGDTAQPVEFTVRTVGVPPNTYVRAVACLCGVDGGMNPSAVVRISRAAGLPLGTLVNPDNPDDGYLFDSLPHTWGGNSGPGPATIEYTMRTEHAVGHALGLVLDFS